MEVSISYTSTEHLGASVHLFDKVSVNVVGGGVTCLGYDRRGNCTKHIHQKREKPS